jgi:tRNA dimethylallyltransferase
MLFDVIPVIVGPTGVGKTKLAFEWALHLKAEIISADAFQVYRGLPVGTAQPPREYLERVPHHLVGIRDPKDPWNAPLFAQEARAVIDRLDGEGKRVVVVGGAGFYVQALLVGLPEGGAPTAEERERVLAVVKRKGPDEAHQWLATLDPAAAGRIHVNDTKRVCRALEKVLYPKPSKADYAPLGADRVRVIGLECPRETLDKRLMARARAMWEGGLLEEARWLMDRDIPETANVWGAIGYREAAAFIREAVTQEEAVEMMFRRTRQYAKRQWTWFKHHQSTRWFDVDGGLESVEAEIVEIVLGAGS